MVKEYKEREKSTNARKEESFHQQQQQRLQQGLGQLKTCWRTRSSKLWLLTNRRREGAMMQTYRKS